MGFRFQKRIKILPGITLNLSKKGVSTSVGIRGARVTLGHGQTRTTVGLPGTGISHTQVTSDKPARVPPQIQSPQAEEDDNKNLVIGVCFVAALFAIAGLLSKCVG